MNTNHAISHVQVTSDTGTLLRALSKTFTNSTTVLSELLQNGRRAGATRIDIQVTDEVIVVQDNGCGIEDFSVLLAVAKSGWEEAVKRDDAPYGIGFISALFSCTELGVMSKGMHLFASTDDLIDLKPVAVNASMDLGVTEIRLHGYSGKIGSSREVMLAIRRMVKGFPVPVFLNDEELDRPHAIGNTTLIETPIGLASPDVLLAKGGYTFYLQGLPIHGPGTGLATMWSEPKGGRPIHLNSPQFEGRLPDRSCLLDVDRQHKAITQTLKEVAVAHVTELSQQLPPAEFIHRYAALACNLGMADVLNAIDLIPASWVKCFNDVPTLTPNGDDQGFFGPVEGSQFGVLTRSQLVASGVVDLDDFDDYGDDALAAHAIFAKGVWVAHSLPAWHWASELVQNVSSDDFTFTAGKEIGRQKHDIWGERVTVVLVEAIEVNTDLTFGERDRDSVSIPLYYDVSNLTLYVTPDASEWDAVRNVTNFCCDDEYDSEAEDDAAANLGVLIDALQNTDAAELFLAVLRRYLPNEKPDVLSGKSFVVTLDDSGGVKTVANG